MLKNSLIIKKCGDYFIHQSKNVIIVTNKDAEKLKKITKRDNYEFSKKTSDMSFISLIVNRKNNFKLSTKDLKLDNCDCFSSECGKTIVKKKDFIKLQEKIITRKLFKMNKEVLDISKTLEEDPSVEIYEKAIKYTFVKNKIAVFEILDKVEEICIDCDIEDEPIISFHKSEITEFLDKKRVRKVRILSKNNQVKAIPLEYYSDFDVKNRKTPKIIEADTEFDEFYVDIPVSLLREIGMAVMIKENKNHWIINDKYFFEKKVNYLYF